MIKIILNGLGRLYSWAVAIECTGFTEPLDHPAIRAMTERELSDLPLGGLSSRQGACR